LKDSVVSFCVRKKKIELQGSGEYIDGGGVGGAFSLLIRGSIIEGKTENETNICLSA